LAKSNRHQPIKKTPPRKPSTALARRQTLSLTVRDPTRRLPAAAPPIDAAAVNTLGEEAATGALGLADVKLSTAEERVLSEAVLESEVRIKPTGQPYLSHPSYTKWFNRAFGRLGWAIVPRSKPVKSGNSVVCPYMLYIHGQPAAFAMGEQEYHESNKEQTYGDALEATVASALRRCAKRLGVGLELWDKRWIDTFMATHGVLVNIETTYQGERKVKKQWRRKDDPPFWNEIKGKRTDEPEPAQRREAPRPAVSSEASRQVHPPAATRKPEVSKTPTLSQRTITPAQVTRLWTIANNAGRNKDEIKAWLLRRYNYGSTTDISIDLYEGIVAMLEAPGKLPERARQPGEDG
jgi:Mitochondrial genome maintenance MGM101